ncbi:MAG TPA: hypothetical protein VIK73_06585 [Limnochordales bacterium]
MAGELQRDVGGVVSVVEAAGLLHQDVEAARPLETALSEQASNRFTDLAGDEAA